jgi:hypothetical protein
MGLYERAYAPNLIYNPKNRRKPSAAELAEAQERIEKGLQEFQKTGIWSFCETLVICSIWDTFIPEFYTDALFDFAPMTGKKINHPHEVKLYELKDQLPKEEWLKRVNAAWILATNGPWPPVEPHWKGPRELIPFLDGQQTTETLMKFFTEVLHFPTDEAQNMVNSLLPPE